MKAGEVFTLTVNYGKSLEEMINAGKYDHVDERINWNKFSHQSSGIVELECQIFHFDRAISLEDATAEMKKEGFEPADAAMLCAYGEKFPEMQKGVPVIVFGCAPTLAVHLHHSLKLLRLGGGDDGCAHFCRFLAVRKIS